MILVPTNDNIVIQIQEEKKEQTTASGIYIPKAAQAGAAKPDKGTVVAVGKGRVLSSGEIIKPEVIEGDEIIFNRFAGTEIAVGEDRYLIIKENDILAIVK